MGRSLERGAYGTSWPINLRADVAFSKDGTSFYLGVGDAY
jgi:hypothetical protein